MVMFYVYATLMVLLNGVWLLISLAGLPGNWLMIGSATLLWYVYRGDRDVFHWGTFVAVIAIAAVGEIIELCAGAMGARKFGGTWYGSVGALAGGLIGAVAGTIFLAFIPIIGTIAGAVGGAFLGATTMEMLSGRQRDESIKAGQGAALGHVTGNLTKFGLGCFIWVILAIAVFNQ